MYHKNLEAQFSIENLCFSVWFYVPWALLHHCIMLQLPIEKSE